MGLQKYREKRDFARTPEPIGGRGRPARQLRFVIQKHAARRLHYDFRLELDGVLKSWAVPKGPSLDPAEKRLAVEVEDHPLEYSRFEGTIPEGQYGAGRVQLWDRGTWTPVGDAREGYRNGRLRFSLAGEKLRGQWTLVRLRAGKPGKAAWLLIKARDEHARAGREADITALRAESVLSGRGIDDIGVRSRARQPATDAISKLPGARRSPLPSMVQPQLATLVERPPQEEGWLYETKYDGYRVLCRVQKGKARLYTRNGLEWTMRLGAQAGAMARLPVKEAWFDGEMVVLDAKGVSSFQALQNAFRNPTGPHILYFVFDLIHLDGYDLTQVPLSERKRLLERLVAGGGPLVRYSDHIEGNGAEFHRQACSRGLEGIIGKRRDAPYVGARTRAWVKVKCRRQQEFVIGGFTDPQGSRERIGALLIGVYEDGRLRYAGRVGTGFNSELLGQLHERLRALRSKRAPFSNPRTGAAARGVHWVKPVLVAQVSFAEWTEEGLVRQASFQGLREDKPARAVVREVPVEASDSASVAGIALTHPGRVLFASQGITKLDLARYYEAVGEWILPHVEGRPLTLVRCPSGRHKNCFFQKHLGDNAPDAVQQVEIEERAGKALYPVANSVAALVALVQMGVLELHTWGSKRDNLEHPDRMIFDLDPDPQLPWQALAEAARTTHSALQEIGLRAFLKTTGGKGLHLVVPLQRRHSWDEVKSFSQALAQRLARSHSGRFTASLSRQQRAGKIFIDYLRNTRGATAVAAFSTRALAGAPVSTPVAWEELSEDLRGSRFNVQNVPDRLKRLRKDPWSDYVRTHQCLTAAMKRSLGIVPG